MEYLLFFLSQLSIHRVHVGWATKSPSSLSDFLPSVMLTILPIFLPIFPPVGFSGIQAISTRLVPITTVFPLNGARAVGPKLCAKAPWETAVNSKGRYHHGYFVFEANSSTSVTHHVNYGFNIKCYIAFREGIS